METVKPTNKTKEQVIEGFIEIFKDRKFEGKFNLIEIGGYRFLRDGIIVCFENEESQRLFYLTDEETERIVNEITPIKIDEPEIILSEQVYYESKIRIGKCTHNGREMDCYIPEINTGEKWVCLLSDGEYILKEGGNPLVICKKCRASDDNCSECKGVGLRKGTSVDLLYIAEARIKKAVEELNEYKRLQQKYF